jgi:hypothetical protein
MNARLLFGLPIVALCIAVLLTGCGSVTSGIAFSPPAGWTGTPAIFGRFQMWIKSGQQRDAAQILMLVKGRASDIHADFTNLPPQYSQNVTVYKHGPVTMCGTQNGEQFVAQGEDKNRKREQIEMTTTVIGDDRYVAMYLRPMTTPADTQAETAIHSLCPLK